MSSKNVFSSLIFITFLVILLFGILNWLQIPKGTLIDWIIGIAATWWLFIIVTLPWNMHFSAKELLDEVKISTEKQLKVNPNEVEYVQKIAKRYLIIALSLHFATAIFLGVLAYLEISPIGYWGAALALLLMGLRPAIRLQAYIVQRLSLIRQEISYPREDAYELRISFEELKGQFETQKIQLDELQKLLYKFNQNAQNQHTELKEEVKTLNKALETSDMKNQAEHERLTKTSEQALAKLSEDTQFLTQIRELIRFIKSA
jgi:hypothetical protein